jgi:hypothetical protein
VIPRADALSWISTRRSWSDLPRLEMQVPVDYAPSS